MNSIIEADLYFRWLSIIFPEERKYNVYLYIDNHLARRFARPRMFVCMARLGR